MTESARKDRDERFRRAALRAMHECRRQSLRASGDTVIAAANGVMSFDQKIEDEREALQLVRDLVALGLASETTAELRRRGESPRPRHFAFEISDKGVQLIIEAIDPVPGVWDERIAE